AWRSPGTWRCPAHAESWSRTSTKTTYWHPVSCPGILLPWQTTASDGQHHAFWTCSLTAHWTASSTTPRKEHSPPATCSSTGAHTTTAFPFTRRRYASDETWRSSWVDGWPYPVATTPVYWCPPASARRDGSPMRSVCTTGNGLDRDPDKQLTSNRSSGMPGC